MENFLNNCPFEIFDHRKVLFEKKIGEGGNANVYRSSYQGKKYAVKVYHFNQWGSSLKNFHESMEYELNVAKHLEKSKRSVKVYGVGYKDDEDDIQVLIFMELLVSNGDLYDYIQEVADWTACYSWKNKIIPKPKSDYVYFNEDDNIHWSYGLSTKQKIKITRLLLLALDELHFLNVVHGDIKTANVVLHNQKKNQLIKLIDFGMSYMNEEDEVINDKTGTPGYRGPEQDDYELYYASDVYSLGVTIVEVWNGDIWYEAEDFKGCRKEMLNGLRKIEKNHPAFGKLLRKSVDLKHWKRPTAREFLNSFNQIQWSQT